MANPAAGVFKQIAYKVEATYGTAPGQSTAQALRRVQSSIDLIKETYQSSEIRTDLQMADFRHGVRRIQGKLTGELSPKTYSDFFAWALKKDLAAAPSATGLSGTIGSPTNGVYPLTRGSGSWLTDGFKVGMVVRITAGSWTASNMNKNLLVTDITSATSMSVVVLNGTTLTAEGPIATSTVAATGKATWVPTSSHTDKSFSIEHWYSDLAQSELFLGCKVSKIALSLPPTGLATIDMDVVGQDYADTTAKRGAVALTAQYFTSPTAATTTGLTASVNGILRAGGATVASLTGLTLEVASNFTGDPVIGSNIVPFQFAGRVLVTGQATAYFDSVTLRDAFVNETEIELIAVFTTANDAAADFLSFTLPRIKLGGSQKNDGEGGLVQTIPFQALLNSTGGSGVKSEKTTIMVQDSAA